MERDKQEELADGKDDDDTKVFPHYRALVIRLDKFLLYFERLGRYV
jgi:hypothetical protein